MIRRVVQFTLCLLPALGMAADDLAFFETRVRPLLAANCYSCHTSSKMGGLRLDSRDSIISGGKSGPAIVVGDPDASLILQAVRRTHERLKMPPTAPLKVEEVETLAAWVKQGAVWPKSSVEVAKSPDSAYVITAAQRAFWSFQPVKMTTPPVINAKNTIDRFVLQRLKANGLKPVPMAQKSTLLRRVTLDLIGLPPTLSELEDFLKDNSPNAFSKVVDRLLASPHYGERWARHWLDLSRYADGQLAASTDTPLPNAYRYRDWVIDAFNKDLPYNQFVKAQIAADQLPESQRAELLPGLGFQTLGEKGHDQVDVTTKVFLGLTVGCAQCHDHKYDPIPTKDFYSLLGVFRSSNAEEYPLVPKTAVDLYKEQKKKVDAMKEVIDDYLQMQQKLLAETLARNTADYMVAAWKKDFSNKKLDKETVEKWITYLSDSKKDHPYLNSWYELMRNNPSEDQVRKVAEEFEQFALDLIEEGKEVEDKNYVAFGGKKGLKNENKRQYTNIVSLETLKFYQWRELVAGPYNTDGFKAPAGVYYYGPKEIDRWLGGFTKQHLEQLRAELKALEKDLPPMYPFLHTMKDADKPADIHVAVRGDAKVDGEIAPRGFLSILGKGDRQLFIKGSGRLELAEAIASAENPLTARVMVNRIWQYHFGAGIVRSSSNFGQMGERPTHPELLDYLAKRFVDSGWSVKAIHREILLSDTYARSTDNDIHNAEVDPENKLLWRANIQPRLDIEALRDSILAVSGKLETQIGGKPTPLEKGSNRRSIYLTVSRTRLDPTMALFDFPDANTTSDSRPVTIGPLQGLFFLNSPFVSDQAKALTERLHMEAGPTNQERIQHAYRILFSRPPDAKELQLGIDYLKVGPADVGKAWHQYVQALFGSGEFASVN